MCTGLLLKLVNHGGDGLAISILGEALYLRIRRKFDGVASICTLEHLLVVNEHFLWQP